MGSDIFSCTALGTDADDAFCVARDQALYDYGHAGYTGSIAEKHDFIVFALPSGVTADKVERRIYDAMNAMWAHENLTEAVYDKKLQRWVDRPTPAKARKGTADEEAAWKWLVAKFGERRTRSMLRAYDDKWGPAVGFELRGAERAAVLKLNGVSRTTRKAFRFMGYASC